MANHMKAVFYGVHDYKAFCAAGQNMISLIKAPDGIFIGDNLFAFNRNLSFLDDAKMMAAFNAHAELPEEQAALWRTHLNCWFARRAMALEGDLVECACHRGTTARIVADYVDLADSDKTMWLYDPPRSDSTAKSHPSKPRNGANRRAGVMARFAEFPNARIVAGELPGVLAEHAPARIAHLHLDLRNAATELAVLEVFFDRLVTGGTIVFDDYGWLACRKQKLADDEWLAGRGASVLELPTGQGLLIK